jgi:hypothetical protein
MAFGTRRNVDSLSCATPTSFNIAAPSLAGISPIVRVNTRATCGVYRPSMMPSRALTGTATGPPPGCE